MIDVQKLAREAGFDVALFDINGPLVYEAEPKHVSMLIALVLEEAAKVCDARVDEEYATGIVDFGLIQWTQSIAAAIRSLKPKGEA